MIIPYDRRTLEGDQSIYLPQANNKFEPTNYEQRVANVLNLDYQGMKIKLSERRLKDSTGPILFRS